MRGKTWRSRAVPCAHDWHGAEGPLQTKLRQPQTQTTAQRRAGLLREKWGAEDYCSLFEAEFIWDKSPPLWVEPYHRHWFTWKWPPALATVSHRSSVCSAPGITSQPLSNRFPRTGGHSPVYSVPEATDDVVDAFSQSFSPFRLPHRLGDKKPSTDSDLNNIRRAL